MTKALWTAGVLLIGLTTAGCGQVGSVASGQASSHLTSNATASSSANPPASASPATSTATHTGTPTATSTAKPAVLPRCGAVWVPGKRLPGGYSGCRHAGRALTGKGIYCESGQQLMTYANKYYAVRSGKIFQVGDLMHDHGFAQTKKYCRG